MEFSKKIQELRRQKGWTQEELAVALYVSRTAVSKWESGRGYPEIESLKRLAAIFSVTVDDLLSGDELLSAAECDRKQHEGRLHDVVFGLSDLSMLLLLFLPLFAQRAEGTVREVSLLSLNTDSTIVTTMLMMLSVVTVLWGVLTLALQTMDNATWKKSNRLISLLLSVASVLVCIVSLQPYAAVFVFAFLMMKGILLLTRNVSRR